MRQSRSRLTFTKLLLKFSKVVGDKKPVTRMPAPLKSRLVYKASRLAKLVKDDSHRAWKALPVMLSLGRRKY